MKLAHVESVFHIVLSTCSPSTARLLPYLAIVNSRKFSKLGLLVDTWTTTDHHVVISKLNQTCSTGPLLVCTTHQIVWSEVSIVHITHA